MDLPMLNPTVIALSQILDDATPNKERTRRQMAAAVRQMVEAVKELETGVDKAEQRRLRQLEAENDRLARLVAKQALEIQRMKLSIGK
jgi:hypothetical protein